MLPGGRQTRKHCFLAMLPGGRQTRKHCFLAMFPGGRQTRKHCFLAMLPGGRQTRKHCFLAMFPGGRQTRKHCFLAMFPEDGQTSRHCFLAMLPGGRQTRRKEEFLCNGSLNHSFPVWSCKCEPSIPHTVDFTRWPTTTCGLYGFTHYSNQLLFRIFQALVRFQPCRPTWPNS